MKTTPPGLTRLFLFGLLLAFAPLLLAPSAAAATASDFLYATLPRSGAEPNNLPYRYFVPASHNASNEYPSIVFLHGSGERGNNNTAQLTTPAALSNSSPPPTRPKES